MMPENGIGSRERKVLEQAKWDMLRSDIYIRDKGVCWICNEKVELKDYDLGHLIDRCNGGQNEYDNLAVMHDKCNNKKPRHTTLEEAMRWKLTAQYLTVRPMIKQSPKEQLTFLVTPAINPPVKPTPLIQQPAIVETTETPNDNNPKYFNPYKEQYKRSPRINPYKERKGFTNSDYQAMSQLTIEYFSNRPELLKDRLNHERSAAIRQLSFTFGVNPGFIRKWIVDSGLVPKRPPQKTDGSQYRYVYEHLDELLAKYETVKNHYLYDQSKEMGITPFYMEIMWYLNGQPEKLCHKDFHSISKRVKQLNIPIRPLSPQSLIKTDMYQI